MRKIAILYQANLPPLRNGIRKPMKQGGYSDSGADIAYELLQNGLSVIVPAKKPDIKNDLDWVFPDTKTGIQTAFEKGANIFWLNTVLYKGHAIEHFFSRDIEIIGQLPKNVDTYDDKLVTNNLLKKNDLSILEHFSISKIDSTWQKMEFEFPVVVKPIRGRGSQGVFLINNKAELARQIDNIFSENKYGNTVYIEQFLSGREITITVMPPGTYKIENKKIKINKYWSLPAVERINHRNGITLYSGIVPVVENSRVLDERELNSDIIKEENHQCEKAAALVNAIAPIRIDCRADKNGKYYLFDLNMKPNMTGASRPHRQNQDSLTLMAAKKIGWNYSDFLINILEQRWKPRLLGLRE